MAKITIEGKEHTCSQRVKEEIEWQDIRIVKAIILAKKIEEIQEEIDEFVNKKQLEISDLLFQIKNI